MNKKLPSPLKTIRAKCLDCVCGSPGEVKLCPLDDCPLYPYRFGRYPEGSRKKRVLTDEQKQRLTKQLNGAMRTA